MREADVANDTRTGGARTNRWSKEEIAILNKFMEQMRKELPGRSMLAISSRIKAMDEGYVE